MLTVSYWVHAFLPKHFIYHILTREYLLIVRNLEKNSNLTQTNFLDIFIDNRNNPCKLFHKPNEKLKYDYKNFCHPLTVFKKLISNISRRITCLSISKEYSIKLPQIIKMFYKIGYELIKFFTTSYLVYRLVVKLGLGKFYDSLFLI